MSRDVGQISPRQALAAGALLLATAWLLVGGLEALVRPGERLPELDAPAEPVMQACPDLGLLAPSGPIRVTAEDLLECPRAYDGRRVAYEGEVVRAVLRRGDRAWVQLNDDPYGLELGPLPAHRTTVGGNSGMAVSVPEAAADDITHVGGAGRRGDRLAVTGVFRRADPADGGAPAVQASAARVTRRGVVVPRPIDGARAVVAGVLATAALGATVAARRGRR